MLMMTMMYITTYYRNRYHNHNLTKTRLLSLVSQNGHNMFIFFHLAQVSAPNKKQKLSPRMKFVFNQLDRSSNLSIKFHQNPNHSKQNTSRKSRTHTETDAQTERQINFARATVWEHSLPDCEDTFRNIHC